MRGATEPFNIAVTGMGGQGSVSLGRVLSLAASRAGWRVSGSEKRGGAQRGGSAEVLLRLLPPGGLSEAEVAAVVPPGCLDLMIGLEPLEAWRRVTLTSARTLVLLDTTPVELALGRHHGYVTPAFEEIQAGVESGGATVVALDFSGAAQARWGHAAMGNLVALGYLAAAGALPFEAAHLRAAATEVLGDSAQAREAWSLGEGYSA